MATQSSEVSFSAPEPGVRDHLRDGAAAEVHQGYEADDGPLSPVQIVAVQAAADEDLPKGAVVRRSCLFPWVGHGVGEPGRLWPEFQKMRAL